MLMRYHGAGLTLDTGVVIDEDVTEREKVAADVRADDGRLATTQKIATEAIRQIGDYILITILVRIAVLNHVIAVNRLLSAAILAVGG